MAMTRYSAALAGLIGAAITHAAIQPTSTRAAGPTMLDRRLGVRAVVSGLVTPVSLAFIGPDDMLVLEKNTGRVQRVVGTGASQTIQTVLDLAVNSASERGLLGIAVHPQFPADPGVYLYWTCRSAAPPADPFRPDEQRCSDSLMLGADSGDTLEVPLLGNRVDRFVWNGTQLVFDRNLIMLHAFQNDGAPDPPGQGDAAQAAAGNHNGGVIRFGPDGKLYVVIGDNGRRGQLQNLADGPTPPTADDQFGGPEPDDAHFTGVVLRLNDDGSTPADNPFFAAGAAMGGEAGANVQRIFSYGVRNSFGMDFDPASGRLWIQENGDDSFDEVHRVDAGLNSGWVQFIGPVGRIGEFKSIETTLGAGNLQQLRWPPANVADTPDEALSRLFMLPGAHYRDPDFSWKFAVAPGGIGFLRGTALGPQYDGDLFVGAARTNLAGGYLFRFNLTGNRRAIAVDDPRLADHVADNTAKFDITESETILAGQDFGIGTDIRTGPNGNLFVVSLSNGEIYEVFRTR